MKNHTDTTPGDGQQPAAREHQARAAAGQTASGNPARSTHTEPGDATRAQSPSATDVRAARMAAGHTVDRAAALVHMDARSWRYYEAGQRGMHPAMWELYRIKCAIR